MAAPQHSIQDIINYLDKLAPDVREAALDRLTRDASGTRPQAYLDRDHKEYELSRVSDRARATHRRAEDHLEQAGWKIESAQAAAPANPAVIDLERERRQLAAALPSKGALEKFGDDALQARAETARQDIRNMMKEIPGAWENNSPVVHALFDYFAKLPIGRKGAALAAIPAVNAFARQVSAFLDRADTVAMDATVKAIFTMRDPGGVTAQNAKDAKVFRYIPIRDIIKALPEIDTYKDHLKTATAHDKFLDATVYFYDTRDENGMLQQRTINVDPFGLDQLEPYLPAQIKQTFENGVCREMRMEYGDRKSDGVVVAHYDAQGRLSRNDGPALHGLNGKGKPVERYALYGADMPKETYYTMPEVQGATSIGGRLTRMFNSVMGRDTPDISAQADQYESETRIAAAATLVNHLPPAVGRAVIISMMDAHGADAPAGAGPASDSYYRTHALRENEALRLAEAVRRIDAVAKDVEGFKTKLAQVPGMEAAFEKFARDVRDTKAAAATEIKDMQALTRTDAEVVRQKDGAVQKINGLLATGPTDMKALLQRLSDMYGLMPDVTDLSRAQMAAAADTLALKAARIATDIGAQMKSMSDGLEAAGNYMDAKYDSGDMFSKWTAGETPASSPEPQGPPAPAKAVKLRVPKV